MVETVEIDFEDKTCTLIDLILGRKKIHCHHWNSWFCAFVEPKSFPCDRKPASIGALRDAPVIMQWLSIWSVWLSQYHETVHLLFAVNCRIVFRKIIMQLLKDLWNTWPIAPSTEVILEFQCFVDGRHLDYWETDHDDNSNASKTIKPPKQGTESTVWKIQLRSPCEKQRTASRVSGDPTADN